MFTKLSIGLSLFAFSAATGCAAAPVKAESATTPARASCAGGEVRGDAPLAAYRGCRRVTGDLRVSGVSSLRPLSALARVDGTLSIRESRLESLQGLEKLTSVDGLSIENNRDLDDISALGNLTDAKSVRLTGNPELTAPDGLGSLHNLDELVIEKSGFQILEGLNGLERVGRVEIRDNRRLISLAALDDVRELDEVVIVGNPVLCGALGVFRGLESAPREVSVSRNRALAARETAHLRPIGSDRPLAMR